MGKSETCRLLVALCLAAGLVGTTLAAGPTPAGGGALVRDAEHGLTWVADDAFVVHAGLSKGVVTSRARGERAMAAMNRAGAFGYRDWRLPTRRELEALDRGRRSGALGRATTTADAPDLTAWLARTRPDEVVLALPVRGDKLLPGFSQVVLLGTNSVRLKNQAEVVSGDVVANDAATGPTLQDGYELSLDPRASIADGRTAGDSVRIKSHATVGGDLAYNDLFNQGIVSGALITPLALPVYPLLPGFVTAVPGSSPVNVPANGTLVLPPGQYGAVTVGHGGHLELAGGAFDVASIDLGHNAQLLFSAPTEVRVAGRLISGDNAVLGPNAASTVSPHDLVIYVGGVNGGDCRLESTPEAVTLGVRNLVGLSIYAPYGTLHAGHASDLTGAFLARDVLIENQARVALDSYFFNRPPVAVDDAATVDEGGTVSVLDSGASSVLANDSDPNPGDTLTVDTTPVSGPAHGTLTLGADGTFTYTHDGSETTADSFVYHACDDSSPQLCSDASVAITVNPVNDPPVAMDDSATVGQGMTVTVLDSGATSVLANDSDAEGGTLTATVSSGPSHGTLTLAPDGTFSYDNDGNESPSDSFVYEVCDDGTPVECATATVTIAVRAPVRVTIIRFGFGDGSVTSSPAGIDCGVTCSATFAGGVPIALTATPAGTSVFGGFSGDPDCEDGVLEPDADKLCYARFDATAVPGILTVVLAGDGSGRVTSEPAGIDCPGSCSAGYPIPTRVLLAAEPDAGSVFTGWSGDPVCSLGDVAVLADTTCVATFTALPPPPPSYQLTLVFLGSGAGTVTSNPPGVLCLGSCTVSLAQGTTLTLFARPDNPGDVAWGGDCTGDSFSSDVVLDSDKTCTVSWP